MHYFIVVIVIILLSFFTFREKRKKTLFSANSIKPIQKEVIQQIALNNWIYAEKLLQPIIKKKCFDSSIAVLYAKILRKNSKYKEALSFIEQAIQKDKHNLHLYKEQGKIFYKEGKSKKAVQIFNKCKDVLIEEEDIIDFISSFLHSNYYEEAWDLIRKNLRQSCSGKMLSLAGDCYFKQKNYERALYYYLKSKKWNYNNYQVCMRSGHCMRCLHRFKEAKQYFQEVLDKDPSDVYATLELGYCFEDQGAFEQALHTYKNSLAWKSSNSLLLCRAGICAVYIHKYDFAKTYLQESCKRGQMTPQILAFLGYSLEALKEWKEAEKIYLYLVKTFPSHVAGYRGLAWLYGVGFSALLSDDQGLVMAKHSLRLSPDLVAWEILSACEARAGNFQQAHHIQECLSEQANDKLTKQRRRLAMRMLRQNTPLNETHIPRTLVA